MSVRYWLCGLVGVAVCTAAALVVTFATYALTNQSLCTAGSDQLACDYDSGQLAIAIGVSFVLAIPIGSLLFAARKPNGGKIGALAISLALTGAAGAALVVGIANPGTSAEAPGLIAGCVLAAIAPIMLVATMIGTFSNLDGNLTAKARAMKAAKGDAEQALNSLSGMTVGSVHVSGGGRGGSASQAAGSGGFGDLAAQLAQIAAARSRTDGDGTAAKLRQLDDLRASGLLTPEEHAQKRRELLDSL